ncbi:MAG: hypothetical protein RLZZ148_3086 [Cyanobacteriota bacterium]
MAQVLSEVISVCHLWAGYEGENILEDINLSVRELDFVGIIGPNGGVLGNPCKKDENIWGMYRSLSNAIALFLLQFGMWLKWAD